MTYSNENTMAERYNFILPEMVENDFSNEDFAEDFDGLQLNFMRVKIPAGGHLQFEFPGDDPEHPSYDAVIEGVIIYNHQAGAYWPEGSEYDDNVSPLCSSVDGKVGIGTPGGACALCELNKFGSDGKGKACKNMRQLYVLRSGEYMPILVSLPPTSIRPFTEFMNLSFVSRHRPTWSSVIQIGLKRIDNGSNVYSVATFKKLYDFSGEQLAQVKQYANNFRDQIRNMLQQRAVNTETRLQSEDAYDLENHYSTIEDGEHFSISGVEIIDGERTDLPA